LYQEADGIELIDIEPAMTGEDFGYLLSKVDGVKVLACHSRFDINQLDSVFFFKEVHQFTRQGWIVLRKKP